MTSRWKIALASAAGAALAAVAVITLSGGASDDAAATVPGGSVPSASEDDAGERSITVSGHGTVQVVPDVADISAGVQARADTASEAMDTVGSSSQALVDTLKGVGIAAEDIQTSGLSLYPTFTNDGATVNGYQASNSVSVRVRDVEQIGDVLDALKGYVGEELTLGGISFSYDDPEAVMADARAAAVDNARVRAEQYAAAAGAELGPVLRIIEGSVPTPVFAREMVTADAAAPASMAIEPGSQDLAADVSVVFAMA